MINCLVRLFLFLLPHPWPDTNACISQFPFAPKLAAAPWIAPTILPGPFLSILNPRWPRRRQDLLLPVVANARTEALKRRLVLLVRSSLLDLILYFIYIYLSEMFFLSLVPLSLPNVDKPETTFPNAANVANETAANTFLNSIIGRWGETPAFTFTPPNNVHNNSPSTIWLFDLGWQLLHFFVLLTHSFLTAHLNPLLPPLYYAFTELLS